MVLFLTANHLDISTTTASHSITWSPPTIPMNVLQTYIIELETDDGGPFANGGAYANKYLLFTVDLADYTGNQVLAVLRCCQKRKGTQDRARVNSSVAERDASP